MRLTFRGLTSDVEVEVTDPASETAALAARLFASWSPAAGDPNPLRYRLRCAEMAVDRDGARLRGVDREIDLVPVMELDLYQQLIARATGWLVLHAAGIVEDGRAVVLAGESGAGKSTATLDAVADGAGYLSDEYVAIAPDGTVVGVRRPLAFDGPPARPVPAAFERVDYPIRGVDGDRVDRLYAPPEAARCISAPLARICLLRRAPDEPSGERPLSAGAALPRLWGCAMTRDPARLAMASELLRTAAVVDRVWPPVGNRR
jgi:hypothetical protein